MNYNNFYKDGDGEVVEYESYSSNVTHQLNVDETVELLVRMGEIEG